MSPINAFACKDRIKENRRLVLGITVPATPSRYPRPPGVTTPLHYAHYSAVQGPRTVLAARLDQEHGNGTNTCEDGEANLDRSGSAGRGRRTGSGGGGSGTGRGRNRGEGTAGGRGGRGDSTAGGGTG
jgi:hypothetical protein